MAEPNPTLARRELALSLKRARERQGRTQDDLASFLGVSLPQVSRLDSGVRGYQPDDVRRLTEWYGISAAECDHLLELSYEARKRAWWQKIDLPDAYRTLIGLEQAASSIWEYTTSVIPGLLQTPGYARALVVSWDNDYPAHAVDQAVEVRMRRQDVLARVPAPTLKVVIDEVALVRAPRDPHLRRAQFEHLLALAELPRITVQVIGFEAGLHVGVGKHLILLGMGGRVPDVAYSEAALEPQIFEQDDVVLRYRRIWDEVRAVAMDPLTSRDRIASYLPGAP